jgi:hypothetical protein
MILAISILAEQSTKEVTTIGMMVGTNGVLDQGLARPRKTATRSRVLCTGDQTESLNRLA